MTKDEALDLALEAINATHPWEKEEAITAIKQARSAPVQEPDHGDELTIAYMSGVHRGKELAAQRQWVGLTDDEIEKACVPLGAAMLSFTEVARAIEAKLKAKNT